ncbi:MAG: acetyl-CoA C-acyltransferase, partial [Chitinophagaceae bacterium]|nr:acetyl-CoA C-acyltransferase [Chitinophagaceae bacterium]
VRTPIGSFGGQLRGFSATRLGAHVIKAACERAGIQPELVDEVIMGCVLQAGLGQAPARQTARFAGLPDQVRATTVNKVCASGMKAVSMAVQSILLGDAEIVVAGGMESMSNVPYYHTHTRWGNKYGTTSLLDGLQFDGLTDVYHQYPMGNAAELCAAKYGIDRTAQDAYAIESYKRSQQATNNGLFKSEIVPVELPSKKGDPIIMDKDEEPFQVDFNKIPQLKPAFDKAGTITAANASTMNDGAAALVLMSTEKAASLGLQPLAIIRGYADAEQAPEWFTTTPAMAIPIALKKAGLTQDQISFFEINEAFSVVALANQQLLQLSSDQLNVRGGAVSLGHPLGCSGARILVTLVHLLQQENQRYGAAGICNGGGGGSAMVLENPAATK